MINWRGKDTWQMGMTLLEVLLALVLLAFVMVIVLSMIAQRSALQQHNVASASQQVRETLAQEAMLLGGPFRREAFSAPSGVWFETVRSVEYPLMFAMEQRGIIGGLIRQSNDHLPAQREDRVGLYYTGKSEQMGVGVHKLLPAEIVYEGEMWEHWFPMEALLVKPQDNPMGTYYRYRWEELSPDMESPLWDFSKVLEAGDMHPVLTVQAYHPDPYYIPSDVVTVFYQATPPAIQYARLDGSASPLFSLEELSSGSNPVVLLMTSDLPSLWEIRYTLDGSAPDRESILYVDGWTPDMSAGESVWLRAKAYSINDRFPPGEELQVYLQPSQAMLTLSVEEVGTYPLVAPADWGSNQVSPEPGSIAVSLGEEVLLEATPAYGYTVEWEGVDRVEGNRAWVTMEGPRAVKVVFRLGTSVVIYDENQQIRSEDRFRYRNEEGEWSEWLGVPEVLNIPEGEWSWEFEIEDRSLLGEYRSLYPVRNYVPTQDPAPLVVLYSKYPLPRALWRVAGEYSWEVPDDAPERVYVEMIGGGAAGGSGWVSRGSHWNGISGQPISFQVRLQTGGGGGSGELHKGVLAVNREHPVSIRVGSGGEASNEYELAYDGRGYMVLDQSVYEQEDGMEGVRTTSVLSYPAVGYGGDSQVSTMNSALQAGGGRIAYNTEYANGNMLGYVHGGDGGFGGGAGTVLEGGNTIHGPIAAGSSLHPSGGKSLSRDFVFYPFSVLEFDHGGMSGAPLWWLSNVYDWRYIRDGSKGGSGTGIANDRQLGFYPGYIEGGVGTWVSLAWVIQLIPSAEWRDNIYRYSPAAEYMGWYSLSDQQHRHLTLLDFVYAGGGGGGVRFKEDYLQQHPEVGVIEKAAQRGWYAATWSNVYASPEPHGYYNTAGEGGSGYGAGGGGASSPWSHPATWASGNGALGHFIMNPPAVALRNPLDQLPSRGMFSQLGAHVHMPETPMPNARGMIGPPGGAGADGLVVIYY